jgi:hypothetical protein
MCVQWLGLVVVVWFVLPNIVLVNYTQVCVTQALYVAVQPAQRLQPVHVISPYACATSTLPKVSLHTDFKRYLQLSALQVVVVWCLLSSPCGLPM